ncbi:hypothetical protein DI005_28835 [Prauserella sp. PE36]|uniref:BTAD domain-containing putative transcriptional regulator n=1 Tax=Prauserella sp. PE36 TaxID=1504709 RepID=UPI000DE3DBF4|nr:BTAD domain-containing putative transcriptional regulator [Prauserella sp. PE36]RBM14694.1 hypothetical protein DI005_28835 [Prauserella sp. PE36]
MQFGVLGPLDVVGDGHRVQLGGPKQRELLAMLLLHANRVVPAGRLVEALWGTEAPARADVTLRSHVLHLRQRLAASGGTDVLLTRRPGYELRADPADVDAHRFELLARRGQHALDDGDPERAADLLREALALWRGPVLDDLGQPAFAQAATARLEELRLVAIENRIAADLALHRHHEVIAELERLVAAHPFREGFVGQLMLALYRSGRQVDALDTHASARKRLSTELGLDPGPALAELETAILRHDPALSLPARRPPGHDREVLPPADALFAVVRRVPIVGRPAELHRLRAHWAEVRKGARRVVFVSGEAGVGKTRLVAEFAHGLGDDAALLVGRCDPASPVPYGPVAGALRASAAVGRVVAGAPDGFRDRLSPLLDGSAGPREAPADDAADERLALFDTVVWLLDRLAAELPVVLTVEEGEHIDRASSLLIRHLVGHLPRRMLVVVCFRDPPGGRHPPLLELLGDLEGFADRLALHPLTEDDFGPLVTGLTGAGAPRDFVRALWRHTGGNPFYATEVVRDLSARAALTADGHWAVPAGVRDVLRHRMHALPEPVRQVVRVAAVLGREVEFDVLARLVDVDEDSLIDALDLLVAAGLLVEAGSSWKASYAFPHDLMRDAVHADLAVPRRQRIHVRAARALLARRPGRAQDVIAAAAHLRRAGAAADPVEAADVALRASDEAARLYAWDEAVGHAETAVAILGDGGAPPDRLADARVRAAMLRLKSSIGYPLAVRHLEAALESYRAAGDDFAVASVHSRLGAALCAHHSVLDIPRAIEHFAAAEAAHGEGRAAFHLQRGLALAAMYGLRTELLGTSSRRAGELAARLGGRELAVPAWWGQAWFRLNRGELSAAAATLSGMWTTARDCGDAYLGWMTVNAAALHATEYLLDPVAGRDWCRRGLAQSRLDTFAHPHQSVLDQLTLALARAGELAAARDTASRLSADAVSLRLLLILDGEWERAEAALAKALAADEAAGDLNDAAVHARWLAGARLLLGAEAGAVAALERALALGVEGPQVPTELSARAELARIHVVSDIENAERHLARCDEILGGGEDWRGLAGVVELARGAVAGARGQSRESDAAYERAVRIFATHRLPWHRAAALHAWACLLLASGRPAEAEGRHRETSALYDELGAVPRWRRPPAPP